MDTPDKFAFDVLNAVFIIRRGCDSKIGKEFNQNIDHDEAKRMKKEYRSIYSKIMNRYEGEELYRQLSDVLDLESYFMWLQFNYIFQNGDYSDEIYFYRNASAKQFFIIPWDFDDLGQGKPHEGWQQRNRQMGNQLLNSSKDKLDRVIAGDPYLYMKYIQHFDSFLDQFKYDTFKNILEKLYGEVYPYYMDTPVIEQSKYDRYGETNLSKLEADLNAIYKFICYRMNAIREIISYELNN
jgi:hypothetical protein